MTESAFSCKKCGAVITGPCYCCERCGEGISFDPDHSLWISIPVALMVIAVVVIIVTTVL